MKQVGLVILVAICIVLQTSYLPGLRPFGIVPDVMLPLVVLIGLYGQASVALVVAVIGGLSVDLASSVDFGLWTGLFVLAALICGYVHRAGVEFTLGVASLMVIVGTIGVSALLLFGLPGPWPWGQLLSGLFIQLVINVGVAIVLRPIVQALVGQGTTEVMVG